MSAISVDHLQYLTEREDLLRMGDDDVIFLDVDEDDAPGAGAYCALKPEAFDPDIYERIGKVGDVRRALLQAGWRVPKS